MISANQSPTVVTITSPGPQGPQGPTGPPGGATTGSNTFTGNQTITGSILISGSIIPAVGVGQTTSSFDLGSVTAAWKDIYVSEGSIKFIKSGSATVTLSAANGGISVNGGSVISADGVSGQFITSKSLDTSVTVKDSNNSLLMGPIEVETDKEIVVEEGSDLTIFGDIEVQNVATADTA
jgi:autotransporter-associated beta strand protein